MIQFEDFCYVYYQHIKPFTNVLPNFLQRIIYDLSLPLNRTRLEKS